MSTTTFGAAGTGAGVLAPFPDPLPRHPDEASSFRPIALSGGAYLLDWHFGDPETTLIGAELYISPGPVTATKGLRAPDLLIAFDVDPEAYVQSNAYVISEQGKSPDFVLEVASESTGHIDVRDKPAAYAALGIPEYWRFDETGEHHGRRLAGDRLVGNRYESIEIVESADGSLEGYSEVLELYLRWEAGQLKWYDPETGKAIVDLPEMERIAVAFQRRAEAERQGRLEAERRAEEERQAKMEERQGRLEAEQRAEGAEHRAEAERQARLAAEQAAAEATRIAEERIRELEGRLRPRASG